MPRHRSDPITLAERRAARARRAADTEALRDELERRFRIHAGRLGYSELARRIRERGLVPPPRADVWPDTSGLLPGEVAIGVMAGPGEESLHDPGKVIP